MNVDVNQARTEVPARRALIVCNGTFDDASLPPLLGTRADLVALRAALEDPRAGFEVTALEDAGLLEVRKAIAKICSDSGPDDVLLFYYSGSSFRDDLDGTLYLPTRDSSRGYANATALDTEFILRNLRVSKCKRFVLFVDGCHAGAFFMHNRGIPDGLYAIMSCGADQLTGDTEQGGVFTRAFVEALESPHTDRDGDGRISLDELYQAIKLSLAEGHHVGTPQKWVWNTEDPIYLSSTAPTVFLSYAREDEELARVLKHELEQRGLAVWIDLEGILAGDWQDKVTAALGRSRCVLFLMTAISLASAPVKNELQFAAARGVPLIPLTEREWPAQQLPNWYLYSYGAIHRRSLTMNALAACMDELAAAIRAVRAQP